MASENENINGRLAFMSTAIHILKEYCYELNHYLFNDAPCGKNYALCSHCIESFTFLNDMHTKFRKHVTREEVTDIDALFRQMNNMLVEMKKMADH